MNDSTIHATLPSPAEFLTSKKKRLKFWIHEHPLTMKVANTATFAFGIGLCCSIPYLSSLPVGTTANLFILGGVSLLSASACGIATLSHLFLDIYASPHHDMKNHDYIPNECEGGKLCYDGDVPVLALEGDNPFTAGKAHGYLCGEAINTLVKRYELVKHTLLGKPRADQLPPLCLDSIRKQIPEEYLTEMKGLLEGYDLWAKENWWNFPKILTLNDITLMHLVPDSLHFDPENPTEKTSSDKKTLSQEIVGCTAIVDRSENDVIQFARNLDWSTYGLTGTKSLIINRRFIDARFNTVDVNVPGFIGTTTGQNSKGLCLAMNVCNGDTNEIKGMPACFYNRYCLENFKSVKEVEKYAEEHPPLGPYHLTAADPEGASTIHFFQSKEHQHVIRRWEENKPLVTLNFRYKPTTSSDMLSSKKRLRVISQHFNKKTPLENALALPYVNNLYTTHSVVMTPKTGAIKVAFDNAYAGKEALHNVSTAALFANNKI